MVAASLVANQGVARCTVRNVARAGGFSTGVVSHYFRDSGEMLFAAYQTAYRSAARRFRDDLLGDSSLDGVLHALERNLPLTPDAVAEWKVRIAFWGVTDFGEEVRKFEETASDSFVQLLADHVKRAGTALDLARALGVAADLEAMLTGLAVQHLMSPSAHPAQSILHRLHEHFYQAIQLSIGPGT